MNSIELTSLIFNGLIGVALYFFKAANDLVKQEIHDLRKAVEVIKDTYYKKEDFNIFKQELWDRLDKLDSEIKERNEFKKRFINEQ